MKSRFFRQISQILVTVFALGSGCRSATDQIQQDAIVQSTESANANERAQKAAAAEMERSLLVRQRLYQGLAGTFRGHYRIDGENAIDYTLKLTPNVWPYRGTRVRSQTEISNDLAKLALNAELRIQSGDGDLARGCVFYGITPDESTGEFDLASDHCAYSVHLWLSDENATGRPDSVESTSADLVDQLLDGKVEKVAGLYFDALSVVNGLAYKLALRREATGSYRRVPPAPSQ